MELNQDVSGGDVKPFHYLIRNGSVKFRPQTSDSPGKIVIKFNNDAREDTEAQLGANIV